MNVSTKALAVACILFGSPLQGQEAVNPLGTVWYRESFVTLDRWRHEGFPRIDRLSGYDVVVLDGNPVLRARADASASYLRFDEVYSIHEFPLLRWSWLVENVYLTGDGMNKSGDDFPLRVWVLFEYDPGKASLSERLQYSAARLLYGEYPPYSSLSYVWESTGLRGRVMVNPNSDRIREIALRSGSAETGSWHDESVNVLEDYRRTFGMEPPGRVTLAIMADADNTGESATAYLRFIEIGAP